MFYNFRDNKWTDLTIILKLYPPFSPQDSSSDGESAPENLSLPKPRSAETPPSAPLYGGYAPLAYGPLGTSQRSPVDVLLRVFPGRRRQDVEATLNRCKGDVLQAIELMVTHNFVIICILFLSLSIRYVPCTFSQLLGLHRKNSRKYLPNGFFNKHDKF